VRIHTTRDRHDGSTGCRQLKVVRLFFRSTCPTNKGSIFTEVWPVSSLQAPRTSDHWGIAKAQPPATRKFQRLIRGTCPKRKM
jgi:hypothetical protein